MPFPSEALLFVFLILTAVMVARLTNLFAAAMLTGMFSLLSACLFTLMDAVDVAFTEASVGAGISTVLILGTLALTSKTEYQQPTRMLPFIVVALTGFALVVGTFDMPKYGSPDAKIHTQVSKHYLEREFKAFKQAQAAHGPDAPKTAEPHPKQVGLQNLVTSVLASYRSYDTLGETAVVFTAGVGVMLLLLGRRRPEDDDAEAADDEAETGEDGADAAADDAGEPAPTTAEGGDEAVADGDPGEEAADGDDVDGEVSPPEGEEGSS